MGSLSTCQRVNSSGGYPAQGAPLEGPAAGDRPTPTGCTVQSLFIHVPASGTWEGLQAFALALLEELGGMVQAGELLRYDSDSANS